MATVLITGAGRGIGLALTQQFAEAGDNVIACARNPEGADALQKLAADSGGKVTIQVLDVSDPSSIKAAGKDIGDKAIDVLINNAGSVGGMKQGLADIDVEEWHRAFDVNTIGPLLMAATFQGNLEKSGGGKLITISSQLAASTWPMGGLYIYGTTKAGACKITQSLALDWADKPISVAVMHPGYVQTDMGGPNAEITPAESATGIRNVIADLTKENSGKFYKWNGEIHPW
jgi:NAD(P)-dependent dehydrogenase (short-subunit alcohol dehydrogenase family)